LRLGFCRFCEVLDLALVIHELIALDLASGSSFRYFSMSKDAGVCGPWVSRVGCNRLLLGTAANTNTQKIHDHANCDAKRQHFECSIVSAAAGTIWHDELHHQPDSLSLLVNLN
jgi:hypothetical protein